MFRQKVIITFGMWDQHHQISRKSSIGFLIINQNRIIFFLQVDQLYSLLLYLYSKRSNQNILIYYFKSFGIDRSTFTTPSESIQSIVPDRIIAMSRDEIPVINALLNRNKFVQKIYCILACHFLAIFIFLLVVNFM